MTKSGLFHYKRCFLRVPARVVQVASFFTPRLDNKIIQGPEAEITKAAKSKKLISSYTACHNFATSFHFYLAPNPQLTETYGCFGWTLPLLFCLRPFKRVVAALQRYSAITQQGGQVIKREGSRTKRTSAICFPLTECTMVVALGGTVAKKRVPPLPCCAFKNNKSCYSAEA